MLFIQSMTKLRRNLIVLLLQFYQKPDKISSKIRRTIIKRIFRKCILIIYIAMSTQKKYHHQLNFVQNYHYTEHTQVLCIQTIKYTEYCLETLNERGFNQKWGVQAFEFALYHWVYNSKHDDKYSEVWTYFFHMISVVVFDLNQRLASPSEWCGDNKMKNIRPTSIEFCQEQLTMDFGGYVTPLNCAKFAFLNLSFNELKDISKKYATYLFNYIEKNDMTIPETHCDVLAGELSNNPQYFEKYKSDEILAKGFNRTDGNQCFELAFKFRKVKSMAKTSFLWDFCVSLIPNEQFESLHEALDIYHWCENENLINK
ncbi:Hypothetical protein CINCED_3A020150 [Cinara cedri]|uniref:Uncharacterized protein n=1 Tax=Cinara cedri TaxID=506608 RepID=A0A5E4NHG7_9HEMI|nr:Hypothetical protein CINCED_3A020150 [Cinara cedri]